jgi:HSP20 family protein
VQEILICTINRTRTEVVVMKVAKRNKEVSAIDQLRREMDQMFDDMVPFSWLKGNGGRMLEAWSPDSDISESEKEYTVRIDLPGMDKNDIKVNYQDGRLTITGERKKEETEEGQDFIRKERFQGSFYRSFTLPEAVKEDEIKASFKNGVLNVEVPKSEIAKPKTIKVI